MKCQRLVQIISSGRPLATRHLENSESIGISERYQTKISYEGVQKRKVKLNGDPLLHHKNVLYMVAIMSLRQYLVMLWEVQHTEGDLLPLLKSLISSW